MAVATLLSPLAPEGEARLAEPSPGLSFDAAVIGLGALATVVVAPFPVAHACPSATAGIASEGHRRYASSHRAGGEAS